MDSILISAPQTQYREAEVRRKHAARSRVVGLTVRTVGDLVIGTWSLLAAFWLRLNVPLPGTLDLLPENQLLHLASAVFLVAVTQNLSLYLFGFYDSSEALPRSRLLQRIFAATSLQGLILGFFFFVTSSLFPRSILVLFVPGFSAELLEQFLLPRCQLLWHLQHDAHDKVALSPTAKFWSAQASETEFVTRLRSGRNL